MKRKAVLVFLFVVLATGPSIGQRRGGAWPAGAATPALRQRARDCGWHGQTRLPVALGRGGSDGISTVKRVWRCHPFLLRPSRRKKI